MVSSIKINQCAHLMFKTTIIKFCFLVFVIMGIVSCVEDQNEELIIQNAVIFDGIDDKKLYEAISIIDGRIAMIGSKSKVLSSAGANAQIIDANGGFVMPGFIEGHGHFSGLGKSLQNLNFLNSANWDEVVKMVENKVAKSEKNSWIEGRGWHQEKWNKQPIDHEHGYPTHYLLSEVSQNNPVILYHASGHSLFANARAMELAGISKETADPAGGKIVRDANGNAIGVFEERAMDLIYHSYQEYLKTLSEEEQSEKWHNGILLATEEAVRKGITSFQDAGAKMFEIERYKALADQGELGIRLWSMIRHSSAEMNGKLDRYKIVNAGNGFFTCNAIKTEVDGALGSYGAWLLEEYSDKGGFVGQNTTEISEVESIAKLAKTNGMQLCVHAIGDRANREVLDLIEHEINSGLQKDHRWRIEHSQHLSTADIPRFAQLGVIPSMQGIHCTSDAPFVEKRLGPVRSKEGAYAWRSLMNHGSKIINGTDAPVEDVDPLKSFYASVTRKRTDTGFEFFTEQKMTRLEALQSYTINCAYAAFEEQDKGSLEIGKYGDLVILDQNLLSCTDAEILKAKILYTIINGKIVYEK